jgi:hypothetical protein
MTHNAIQEQLNGKTVEWMEKVSDEQYSTIIVRRNQGHHNEQQR